jgi:ion channel-forming bestrophin family protein
VYVVKHPTWLQIIFSLQGTVLPRIWARVAFATGLAVVLTAANLTWGVLKTNLTPLPFTLIAVALGIFLGFRNNTSYDRFWEGRKLWGALVNISRSLARQNLTHVGGAGAENTRESADLRRLWAHRQVKRQIAYVHLLRHHLRGEDTLNELGDWLTADEIARLVGERNRPIAVVQWLGEAQQEVYSRGWITDVQYALLDQSLVEMLAIQGGCERIKATPIPFSYSVLIHRIVAVYCLALPFGIVETVGHFTPLVVALISYAFYGLDAVGDEIEDPFGLDPSDLPLSAISRTIEVNLRQRLGDTALPPFHEPVNHLLT